jgi:mannonate dehydratase
VQLAEILTEQRPSAYWRVLPQVGVDYAVGILPRAPRDWRHETGELPWELGPLSAYAERVADAGLRLVAIEDNPPMERIRLGRPGRDEEIEHVCTLIRSMGALEIPVLCYHWMPILSWIRTTVGRPGRGGALVSAFDVRSVSHLPVPRDGPVAAETLWASLEYFLRRVLPVAEEAGVRLAMHPDDPPLSPVRGVARIMSNPEAFERLVDLVSSDSNGITFCQGNFALMTDDLPSLIESLGTSRKFFYVHFRDVRGTAASFVETFHDEGPTDMLACVRAYARIGFDGPLRVDHVPQLAGEDGALEGYSRLGALHAIGYVTGLREAAYGRRVPDGRSDEDR